MASRNNTGKYKVIEGFCGPGGLSLGLKKAGFNVLLAFDNNSKAIETYNANNKSKGYVLDAREVTGRQLRKLSSLEGRLDLFSGGSPCQGFSKQKRGAHLGDGRNDLVLEYARIVDELSPRFFLLENVAMLGQKRGKDFIGGLKELLSRYDLFPHFYNAADYGLAQTRQRFVIVGRHKNVNAPFRVPKPTVEQWKTVREFIADLPEPPEDYSVHPDFPNHQNARVTDINIERFKHVPQGGGWRDIPNDLRLDCHKNADTKKGGWPDVYGRLSWEGQCPTITGGFDSFTRGRYGHPEQHRPITPREAARLQGFPDKYAFIGNRGDVRSQIGNVVPPPLAESIGKEIIRSLKIADGVLKAPAAEKNYYDEHQLDLMSVR